MIPTDVEGHRMTRTTRRHGNAGSRRLPRSPRRFRALDAAIGLLLLLLLTAVSARAQGQVRAMGMANAYTAAARGLDAVDWNPANLALRRDRGLAIGLASVAVDLNNNSFSLNRYNEISGAVLTEADKLELLSDIPEGGLDLNVDVQASALGFCAGPFALSVQGIAGGSGTLDKDFFDLILMGNAIGQSFEFESTDGEAFAVGAVTLTYARPLLTSRAVRLSAGVNARYLHGIYDVNVEEATGGITAAFDKVYGAANASYVTSTGGTGYAVDAGLMLQAPRGWVLGLAVSNVASRLTWDRGVERTEWSATADSLTALMDGDLEDLVAQSDTTYAAAAYDRSLPGVVRLGASNVWGPFQFGVDLAKGIEERPGVSDQLEINVGVEWRLFSWFRPRFGAGFGGEVDRSAAGLGLHLGPLRWDVAVANRGKIIPDDTKGLAVATGVGLEF
jgi:hypothetical protein